MLIDVRRSKKKAFRRSPPDTNVISIVGDVTERRAIEAERHAAVTQRRDAEAGATHARAAAELEEFDIDGALAACNELPPEEARVARVGILALRAQKRCQHGDVAGGLAEWEALIANHPDVVQPYVMRSDWLGKTDPKAAMPDLERALALDPDNFLYYLKRGAYHIALGDLDRALADYNRAVAIDPQHPDAHFQMGKVLVGIGDHEGGLAAYDKALRLAPQYMDIHVCRGEALLYTRQHERALREFDHVLSVNPRDPEAHYGRGKALAMLGERRLGFAALSRAIELAPEHAHAHLFRAVMWHGEEGAAARAAMKADITRAAELDPRNAAVLLEQSKYLLELGEAAEALAVAEKAIAIEPEQVPMLYYQRAACKRRLAEVRRGAGQQEREMEKHARCTASIDDLERAIALGAATEQVYMELIQTHMDRLDKPAVVGALLDRAVAALPDSFEIATRRYAFRKNMGDEPGAAADAARLLKLGLHPDDLTDVMRQFDRRRRPRKRR